MTVSTSTFRQLERVAKIRIHHRTMYRYRHPVSSASPAFASVYLPEGQTL
jgi:hypothetical protein